MKASIILLSVICGVTKALTREHFYINIVKDWNNAQSFCRTNYEDLSRITSQEEQDKLMQLTGNTGLKWIGLHREMNSTDHWMWSNGRSLSFSEWAENQPDNLNGIQYCVAVMEKWYDFYCTTPLPFFCCKTKFILVKEKRSWEEALQYCRTHHTDLASMSSDIQLELAKQATTGSQTDSVWTGLRYLVGEWFWVNNEPLWSQISLPECPAQNCRCGARNTTTDRWENRDCTDKLNFLCN